MTRKRANMPIPTIVPFRPVSHPGILFQRFGVIGCYENWTASHNYLTFSADVTTASIEYATKAIRLTDDYSSRTIAANTAISVCLALAILTGLILWVLAVKKVVCDFDEIILDALLTAGFLNT